MIAFTVDFFLFTLMRNVNLTDFNGRYPVVSVSSTLNATRRTREVQQHEVQASLRNVNTTVKQLTAT
jgi:hypothetical protein